MDASLLWLAVPFGAVEVADTCHGRDGNGDRREPCLSDGGVRRYKEDTYYGGGAWPLLTAWLGWYRASQGNLVRRAGAPPRSRGASTAPAGFPSRLAGRPVTRPTTCHGLGVGASRLPTSPGPTRCTSSCGTSSTNGYPTRLRAASQLRRPAGAPNPPSKQASKPPLNHRGDQQRRKGQHESYARGSTLSGLRCWQAPGLCLASPG